MTAGVKSADIRWGALERCKVGGRRPADRASESRDSPRELKDNQQKKKSRPTQSVDTIQWELSTTMAITWEKISQSNE